MILLGYLNKGFHLVKYLENIFYCKIIYAFDKWVSVLKNIAYKLSGCFKNNETYTKYSLIIWMILVLVSDIKIK